MKKFLLLLLSTALTVYSWADTIKVNSIPSLQSAVNSAKPGDIIIVASGKYIADESIFIKVAGTAGKHIIIQSEKPQSAEIAGTGGFQLLSPTQFIEIKGFVFTNTSGTFRIEPGVTNCIISGNIFECAPSRTKGSKPYLNVSGDDNEICYNTFRNKKDEGQMLSIQGPGGDKMAKRVLIHHNYFHDFPKTGLNNCSAIQIGLSGRSMDSAFCVVEYNLFERTEGENEGAICHKSCRNIIRFNTFGEKSEECSIRHGNKSQVYGNFFLNTTGLRFSGDDHLIYGNYFENCTKAIVCQNGDGEVKDGSKLTCHDRADRVVIAGNTIIQCKSSYQMPAREGGLGATDISFIRNLIRDSGPVEIKGSYPHAVWKDNVVWNTEGGEMPETGYKTADIKELPSMKNADYPAIPNSNKPLTKEYVGANAKIMVARSYRSGR